MRLKLFHTEVFFYPDVEQELEYPDVPSTDYNLKAAPANAAEVNERSLPAHSKAEAEAHCSMLEVGMASFACLPCFAEPSPGCRFVGGTAVTHHLDCM